MSGLCARLVSEQVQASSWSSAFTTSCNSNSPSRHHPPFPGGICWNDSLGSSMEMGGGAVVLSMCFCMWMGEWVETGVGRWGRWEARMEKTTITATKIFCSRMREYIHPTAVSTVQHILHIYIYQVFPNSLVFVLKSHTKMSGKAVTGKLIFLVVFAKLFLKFCIYIINQAEELTVITNIII